MLKPCRRRPESVAFLLTCLLTYPSAATGCWQGRADDPADAAPRPEHTAAAPEPLSPGAVGFPEYPSLSPDGRTVAFSWAGDLWAVSVSGGTATRLTAHAAEERRSAFSPDGSLLAFESDREGARNLYVMDLSPVAGGALVPGPARRLTTSDRTEGLGGFSADGRSVLFAGERTPAIFAGARMYSVPVAEEYGVELASTGAVGRPVEAITQAFGSFPRAAPGGGAILFVRNRAGLERPRYRGPGQQDIWRLEFGADDRGTDVPSVQPGAQKFTQITFSDANDSEPFEAPDGSILFISSRDGQNNLWRIPPGGTDANAEQLTRFSPGDASNCTIAHGVRDLAVSRDGSTAVLAVWDTLYRLNLREPKAQPQPISIIAAADTASLDFDRRSLDKDATEAALSPDGKTLAVIARGEVFVRSAVEGYPTRRVTATHGRERDLVWSSDGRYLYFSSDEPNDTSPPGAYAIWRAEVEVAREDLSPAPKPQATKSIEPDAKPADPPAPSDPAPAPADPGAVPEPGPTPPIPPTPPAPPAPPPAPELALDDPAQAASSPSDDKPADKTKAGDKAKAKTPDYGKRWNESLRFKTSLFIATDNDLRRPLPSPDGKALLYTRGLGDVLLRELPADPAIARAPAASDDRLILSAPEDPELLWAPDSRHILATLLDLDFNADIWVVDTERARSASEDEPAKPAGSSKRESRASSEESSPPPGWEHLPTGLLAANLTRHPDIDDSPRLTADGKVLYFLSQRGSADDEMDIYSIYLDRELEAKTAYEIDEYVKKAAEAAGKRKPIAPPGAKPEKEGAKKKDAGDADDKNDEPADKEDGDQGKADEKKDGDKAPKPKDKEPEPLKLDVEDAYLRVRRVVSLPESEGALEVSPGGDRIIFSAEVDGERQLFSVDHKGKDRKQLAPQPAPRDVRVTLTGDKVSFIRSGVTNIAPKAGGKLETLGIDAPVVIDVAKQQRQKFLEAARVLGANFYHHDLKGLDWDCLTERYAALAERTRTSSAFNRVTQMLFGELDGSHTGIWGGDKPAPTPPAINTGYLGVTVEPAPGGYRVTRVTNNAPADLAPGRIAEGDVLVSVDGVRFAPDDISLPTLDFDAAFAGKANKETLIEVRAPGIRPGAAPAAQDEAATIDAEPSAQSDQTRDDRTEKDAAGTRLVLKIPVSYGTWDRLAYMDEVARRRARVSELSEGKIGYLHIRSMGEESVREFERDLFAAGSGKDGLIIDVRDNGGGYTADILLASLTAPRHAYTASRAVDPTQIPRDVYPRDRRLIYAWTRPINVLINQNSFSNAEIFAHAIKTINRGKLVGTQTFGGVISTGAYQLIDGTTVRTPFRGWYLPDGSDMENNGAVPDIAVEQTPESEVAGEDPQLAAAVRELMSRLSEPPQP